MVEMQRRISYEAGIQKEYFLCEQDEHYNKWRRQRFMHSPRKNYSSPKGEPFNHCFVKVFRIYPIGVNQSPLDAVIG